MLVTVLTIVFKYLRSKRVIQVQVMRCLAIVYARKMIYNVLSKVYTRKQLPNREKPAKKNNSKVPLLFLNLKIYLLLVLCAIIYLTYLYRGIVMFNNMFS